MSAQPQSVNSSAHRGTSSHKSLSKVVIDPLSINPEYEASHAQGRLVSYFSLIPSCWWRGEDLNLRRHPPADLQSAPFGHLGTPPQTEWSWRWDSNPQPADYKSAALPIELRQRRKKTYIVFRENARKKFQKKICFNHRLKQSTLLVSAPKAQTARPTAAGRFSDPGVYSGCRRSPVRTGCRNSCARSLNRRTNVLFKLCPEQET